MPRLHVLLPAMMMSLALPGGLGCAEDMADPVFPGLVDGKADAGDRVTRKGPLGLGSAGAVTGVFAEDLEFHGWELALRPGAVVQLEVTQKGSSRGLDTTLYVFGPMDPTTGAFGSVATAFDDDLGYARLSYIKRLEVAGGGKLLVVVGTRDGRGRGNYRLEARCLGERCEPEPEVEAACHLDFIAAIEACVSDQLASGDVDPVDADVWELTAQCGDVEVLAGVKDRLCASGGHAFCSLDLERFDGQVGVACRREAGHRLLDRSCVFGDRYRDLFGRAEAMVVLGQRTLRLGDTISALRRDQIIAAVRQTAYSDVGSVEEAFEAVDEGVVNLSEVWDASNRKAYTVYEVGAGDNSFGAIFDQGGTAMAAAIQDGDLAGCKVTWGDERRRCGSDQDCRGGTRCVGQSEVMKLGRCVDATRDGHPADGQTCEVGADDFGCPAGSGLVCAGAGLDGEGLCGPAWMRGRFASEPGLVIPDGVAGGVESQLLAFGLATVDMDVKIDLHIAHPRPADLRVTLTNPSDNEVVVFDGATEAAGRGEVWLSGKALRGFSGDESVNGVWRLKVVDRVRGEAGTLYRFGLELTSRWD